MNVAFNKWIVLNCHFIPKKFCTFYFAFSIIFYIFCWLLLNDDIILFKSQENTTKHLLKTINLFLKMMTMSHISMASNELNIMFPANDTLSVFPLCFRMRSPGQSWKIKPKKLIYKHQIIFLFVQIDKVCVYFCVCVYSGLQWYIFSVVLICVMTMEIYRHFFIMYFFSLN